MSAWTWEQQSSAADWMVIPTGQAGLGLQVPLCLPACLPVYYVMSTALCLQPCVYYFVSTMLCLQPCVYYLVSTTLCLLPCVYYFVCTTLCPLPCVYRIWLCVSLLSCLST